MKRAFSELSDPDQNHCKMWSHDISWVTFRIFQMYGLFSVYLIIEYRKTEKKGVKSFFRARNRIYFFFWGVGTHSTTAGRILGSKKGCGFRPDQYRTIFNGEVLHQHQPREHIVLNIPKLIADFGSTPQPLFARYVSSALLYT